MLIPDEPTDGLDRASRREVLDLLRQFNRESGVTLLVSSHLLPEVEDLCAEVAILSHGQLVRTRGIGADRRRRPNRHLVGSARAVGPDPGLPGRGDRAGRDRLAALQVSTRDQLDLAPADSLEAIYLTATGFEEAGR